MEQTPELYNSRFMKAVRGEAVDRPPVWMMRQAGRYMAEYQAVRENVSFLELCHNPTLCADVMVTAINKLGVDAAIIFSDLLPILVPLGFSLEFGPGHGPVIHNPVSCPEDLKRVIELERLDELDFVMETVVQTRRQLPTGIPLIGFAGAPFTLASYILEGGASRSFTKTKRFMYLYPTAFSDLMGTLSRAVVLYLKGQIAAGAQVVQLFDSWIGCLSPAEYKNYVFSHVHTLLDEIEQNAPAIHFGTGNPALIPLMTQAGGTVIGVDWRLELSDAWDLIDAHDGGRRRSVQGNLDPAVLLTTPEEIAAQTIAMLDSVRSRRGLIVNLGHGIIKETPVENAIKFVKTVRNYR